MFGLGTQELMFIGLVILVLFGAKKIPEFMGGIGKGVKEFKKGMTDLQNEMQREDSKDDELKRREEELKRKEEELNKRLNENK